VGERLGLVPPAELEGLETGRGVGRAQRSFAVAGSPGETEVRRLHSI